MRVIITILLFWGISQLHAQSLTSITPDSAYQGQFLHTVITSSGLFLTGSSPQGNVQSIILKNATDSAFAVSDSTNVVSTSTVNTFLAIPANLATGIYDLVVRIYNASLQTFTDYFLSSSFTVTAPAVWPGDVNADKMVDMADLLYVGLAFDSSGPARTSTLRNNIWQKDTVANWSSYFSTRYFPNHLNCNNADCNGDGVVDFGDTTAILQNFSLSHSKTRSRPKLWRSGLPGITFKFSTDTLYDGDSLTVTFFLGDSGTTVSHFYGLAFNFNYDSTAVNDSFTYVHFGNSWLGDSTDKISLSRIQPSIGQIKTGITRINHIENSGSGYIGFVKFKIRTDNISGKSYAQHILHAWISDVQALDKFGNPVSFNEGSDSTVVNYYPSGLTDIHQGYDKVFPNPANTNVTIFSADLIKDVRLVDQDGRVLMQKQGGDITNLSLNVSALPDAVYLIQVRTDKGTTTRKLVVSK